jgi:hypothetical protein
MTKIAELFTVTDVARLLEITPGRVRQICRELELGQVFGKTRLLTVGDVAKIRSRGDGRRFNGKKNT